MNRIHWQEKNPQVLILAEALVDLINQWKVPATPVELSYKKLFIGLTCRDKPLNFITFSPTQGGLPSCRPRCRRNGALDRQLRNAGFPVKYQSGSGRNRYIIPLTSDEILRHAELLKSFARLAYDQHRCL